MLLSWCINEETEERKRSEEKQREEVIKEPLRDQMKRRKRSAGLTGMGERTDVTSSLQWVWKWAVSPPSESISSSSLTARNFLYHLPCSIPWASGLQSHLSRPLVMWLWLPGHRCLDQERIPGQSWTNFPQESETWSWRHLSFHIGCLTREVIQNKKPCLIHMWCQTRKRLVWRERERKKQMKLQGQETKWL